MITTLVVFLGNISAGDDASGFYVYQKFSENEYVRKLFLGTDLFRLHFEYKKEKRLILVDAMTGINEVTHIPNKHLFEINNKSEHAHFLSAIEILKILKIVMPVFPQDIHLIGVPARDFKNQTFTNDDINKVLLLLNTILKNP